MSDLPLNMDRARGSTGGAITRPVSGVPDQLAAMELYLGHGEFSRKVTGACEPCHGQPHRGILLSPYRCSRGGSLALLKQLGNNKSSSIH